MNPTRNEVAIAGTASIDANGRSSLGAAVTTGYALGSFGTGVFSTVPTILLLYYCTQVLKIPAVWAAAIVFVPKAWAIVWDPLVGAWSDRTTGRFGRRRPFLAVGAVGVPVCFIALFCAPTQLTLHATAVWVAVSYFALTTLYSVFAVPYIAVPPEVAADAAGRSRLVAWRMTVAMVGVLAGGGLAPFLIETGGGGRVGHAVMAIALGGACAIAMISPVFALRRHDPLRAAPQGRDSRTRLMDGFRVALRTDGFFPLALSYLLLLTAAGALTSAAPYLITQVLGHAEASIGTAMTALLLATTMTIPWWSRIGRAFGDRRVLALAAIAFGAAVAGIGWGAEQGASWAFTLVLFAAAGVPFAAAQVLPFTLLAHLVHTRSKLGGSTAGVLTGAWTAMEKLGLAFGPALTGLALAVGDSRSTIPMFIAFVPAILSLAALVPQLSRRTRSMERS